MTSASAQRSLLVLCCLSILTAESVAFVLHRISVAMQRSRNPTTTSTRVMFANSFQADDNNNVIAEYDDFLPFPHEDIDAVQVVEACMNTLLSRKDAGLEVCWNFSSDRCRASQGGSLESFRKYASNPVFGYLVNCSSWKIISVGPIIQGTPTRGAMQTVLIDAISNQTDPPDARRFLWTLQKERRPPRQGCYLVHECIYVRNAYDLTL